MEDSEWLSFHLYYHEDLLRPIQGFVRPAVVDLLPPGKISRFFFVRYGLGGPHLRLRLQPQRGAREEVRDRVEKHALAFLASTPSQASLTREAIEDATRSILQSDPDETDETLYPDNWFQSAIFRPETNRYGGAAFLEASLDFFAISSLEALVFLHRYATEPRSRQLPRIFRLLLRQTFGFAANPEEFGHLLRYAEISWAENFPRAAAKADSAFERQRDIFASLFEEEARDRYRPDSTPDTVLLESARSLGRATRSLDTDHRWVIGGSQLHMTANRLGVSNPEEVYLSRLLSLTWLHLQTKQSNGAAPGTDTDATFDSEAKRRWIKVKLSELTQ